MQSTVGQVQQRAVRPLLSRLLLGLVLTLLTSALLPVTAAAALEPTTLGVKLQASGNTVVVTGTLARAGGQPIANQPLTVVGVGDTDDVVTGPNGGFTGHLVIPGGHPAGTVTVQVNYAGGRGLAPAAHRATVAIAPPPVTRLTVIADRTTAAPGDVVLLSGRLLNASGAPIQQGSISAGFGRTTSDVSDLTDETGAFVSLAQVPLDARPGPAALRVSYAGSAGNSEATVVVTVEIVPQPTPTPTPPNQETPSPAAATTTHAEQDSGATPGTAKAPGPTEPRSATSAAPVSASTDAPQGRVSQTALLALGGMGTISLLGAAVGYAAVRDRRLAGAARTDDDDRFIEPTEPDRVGTQSSPRRGYLTEE